MRRVALRIVPFLMVCYFVSFLDRVNLGFAALQMVKDLHLSPTVFGFGGGIFFLSYFLCEVPSNLLQQKVGARFWIARIMITWGVLAGAMAFVTGPRSFYVMRLLLGAAEAGFFPGVILYLTYWFPSEHRARIIALFTVAIPISSFLGSPISAALLGANGWLGLRGWQWMFIIEAAPAVLLGFCLPGSACRPSIRGKVARYRPANLANGSARRRKPSEAGPWGKSGRGKYYATSMFWPSVSFWPEAPQ